MAQITVPKLVTFDGEARSGKGTIVQITKDFLRDEHGYKVMLIDRGQVFRVLVVAAAEAGVDLNDSEAIDDYLSNAKNIEHCVQFVKDVYHMDKETRDALLYTDEVGANSAKVGARPASQDFVKKLTKKWLHDAGTEGYDVVLVDGRALESIAKEMDAEHLCQYRLGLYFICDPQVGARRTLGYAAMPYDKLPTSTKNEVDTFVKQIIERNQRDLARDVERLVRPDGKAFSPLELAVSVNTDTHAVLMIDTSADMTKREMSKPIADLVVERVKD